LEIGTGVQLTGDNDTFDGLIDEVRIWDYGRSQEEILATMHVELSGTENGLFGYWNFNEGVGQIAADSTANGNDARLGSTSIEDQNDPVWSDEGAPVVPITVGGNVTGMSPAFVVCNNRTTGQTVATLLGGDKTWDCEAEGLVVVPGDSVQVFIRGSVD